MRGKVHFLPDAAGLVIHGMRGLVQCDRDLLVAEAVKKQLGNGCFCARELKLLADTPNARIQILLRG